MTTPINVSMKEDMWVFVPELHAGQVDPRVGSNWVGSGQKIYNIGESGRVGSTQF